MGEARGNRHQCGEWSNRLGDWTAIELIVNAGYLQTVVVCKAESQPSETCWPISILRSIRRVGVGDRRFAGRPVASLYRYSVIGQYAGNRVCFYCRHRPALKHPALWHGNSIKLRIGRCQNDGPGIYTNVPPATISRSVCWRLSITKRSGLVLPGGVIYVTC